MKTAVRIFCAALLLGSAQTQSLPRANGYVPDERTAVKIAEALLIPVYGEKQIESESAFRATLENGIWTVAGTLRYPDGKGGTMSDCVGGLAVVKKSKLDARIVSMTHTSKSTTIATGGDSSGGSSGNVPRANVGDCGACGYEQLAFIPAYSPLFRIRPRTWGSAQS